MMCGMSHDNEPIELDLLRNGTCVELHTAEPVIIPLSDADDVHVGERVRVHIEGRIGLQEDDDVEFSAFGLIYTFAALSFSDARPRGYSTFEYQSDDEWTAADMLRHLRFERGELRFYADYVRGRMLKTCVVVRKDGTFLLETMSRGETAMRWLAKLKGEEPTEEAPIALVLN